MNLRLGSIDAQLVQHAPDNHPLDELVNRINSVIKPPDPVSADDIYIRAMYLVSDEVNLFGGRFPSDEHTALLPLLTDVPVMIGHRKDRLPIARTFAAIQEQRDGFNWVKVLFYWMKSADGAQSLLENIDGGIYRECSIGFIYRFPECSICGEDMRRCSHEPLRLYNVDDTSVTAHYNYRQIERVLECSIVYRGAQPNTAITRVLTESWQRPPVYKPSDEPSPLLVTPGYDGIPVMLSREDDTFHLESCNGQPLPDTLIDRFKPGILQLRQPVFGQLIGYRGRQRCSSEQTHRFIAGGSETVSRVELKLLLPDLHSLPAPSDHSIYQISRLRYRITEPIMLPQTAAQLATRDGVRVWRLPDGPPYVAGARYDLNKPGSLKLSESDNTQILTIHTPGLSRTLELCGKPIPAGNVPLSLTKFERRGDGYLLTVDGRSFLLRPVVLHGSKRFLCTNLTEARHAFD